MAAALCAAASAGALCSIQKRSASLSRSHGMPAAFSPLPLSQMRSVRQIGRLAARASSSTGLVKSDKKVAEDSMPVEKANLFEELTPSMLAFGVSLLPMVLDSTAFAAGGEYGLLEGRSVALLHPLLMFTLFGLTCYAGWLGWQWKRVRLLANEITALKATVPADAAGMSPVQSQIDALVEERKALVKGNFKDLHHQAGSWLLGLGVATAVGGCLNTWSRTGKLFPGPHLFAGAGMTVIWALAAAQVPAMQKGDETARSLHIAFNAINFLLFVWQIPTGLDIVYKVFEFTSWP